jgi:hypothetical protein
MESGPHELRENAAWGLLKCEFRTITSPFKADFLAAFPQQFRGGIALVAAEFVQAFTNPGRKTFALD